ncbi:MAG: hypothetical protein JRN06_09100 [Nitrososphaerota archaeon]|nr:hypothetical protein [Nitrososphaerota archaeon]MDG7024742.1 hypothetical protein [Nitrososphaerota archaeon]
MGSHQGLAGQLSALFVLLIIVMGGVVVFPFHPTNPAGGRLGGAKVTALQFGNATTSSSFTLYNTTTSSSTTPISTTSSNTTTIRSTHTNSTSFSTTTSFLNSTTTTSSTNSTLVQNVSAKWDPSTDFYSFLNYGLFNDGGDCYGFSSTAILYFRHYQLGDQTYPYYPESTASVSALPGQTGYYTDCFLGSCFKFTTSDTLSQSTFPLYVHEAYGGYQLPSDWSNPTNEQAQVLLLEQGISSGVPVLLALGPADGHAVIAWSYERFSNGNLVIGISDPNYGNVPRDAYLTNGQFSYVGTASWSTFTVVSPEMLQWAWLAPIQLSQTVTSTNPYYNFVFSSVPITIVSGSGSANFTSAGDSLTFRSSIAGVVGFEEGGIQAYAIPEGMPYTILDPGTISSMLEIIIPQNATSVAGYRLTSASSAPLSLSVVPTIGKLNVTTSNSINISVALFSATETSHSIVNATSIPVSSSQTAVVSVPDWNGLNTPSSAPSLQVFSPGSSQPVTSYTLTNGQQGLTNAGGLSTFLLPLMGIIVVVAASAGLVAYARRRRQGQRIVTGQPT